MQFAINNIISSIHRASANGQVPFFRLFSDIISASVSSGSQLQRSLISYVILTSNNISADPSPTIRLFSPSYSGKTALLPALGRYRSRSTKVHHVPVVFPGSASRTLFKMRSLIVISYTIWLGILLPTRLGSAIVQLEARDHGGNNSGDKLGAVASESAVCSQIGVELIEQGGNAADAVG